MILDTPKVELAKQTKRFTEWWSKHQISACNPILGEEVVLDDLLPLCFDERKDNLSLHAIWLLEKYVKAYPDQSTVVVPKLVGQLHHIHIEGSQRIAGNILIETLRGKSSYRLNAQEEEAVIETTFHWMISPKKAIAVVANCFEVLSYLSDRHPWIKDELIAQINFFMKDGSAAIQARGKKILTKLRKNTSHRHM